MCKARNTGGATPVAGETHLRDKCAKDGKETARARAGPAGRDRGEASSLRFTWVGTQEAGQESPDGGPGRAQVLPTCGTGASGISRCDPPAGQVPERQRERWLSG